MLRFLCHGSFLECCSRSTKIGSFAVADGRLGIFAKLASPAVPRSFSTTRIKCVSRENAVYVEDMYQQWRTDPARVHPSWNTYFEGLDRDGSDGVPRTSSSTATGHDYKKAVQDHMSVQSLIRSYQVIGHRVADLDPLKLDDTRDHKLFPELDMASYGFGAEDLERKFLLPSITCIGGKERYMYLKDIVKRLNEVYCGSVGVQYMFIPRRDQSQWIRQKFESPDAMKISNEEKKTILKQLIQAAGLESFLEKKWPSEKRFGLEGCESLIPAMQSVIDHSPNVDTFVLGMAHRGRLNVIANVCQKPLDSIFAQFKGLGMAGDEGSGDVKYHLGLSQNIVNEATGRPINISLCANPSHLEAVNPVVQGKTKAEQFYRGDAKGEKVLSIVIHGDAAFAGQGVVFETINMSGLPDYTTHGTIHVVINNQIGFTTDPRVARSSPYCTDVAKVVNAPIFHVNADDPEAVLQVCRNAAEYRSEFHRDVVIDLVGYRKNGHNEIDEPAFTQPVMYERIRKKKGIAHDYAQKLISEGVVTAAQVQAFEKEYLDFCEASYKRGEQQTHVSNLEWVDSPWTGEFALKKGGLSTGVEEDIVLKILDKFSEVPADLAVHRGVARMLDHRRSLKQAGVVDWSMGEAVAWGSLLGEGNHVRLSGQDVERGTFSHRHHVLHDQNVFGKVVRPLCSVLPNQAEYSVNNSSLSEAAVLGFELGFSMTNPNALVMWEAQFGDFNNTAQGVIDQFIASGEAKWIRQAGIVLLLPHGYEGMGPEHSSARLERFLQLCSDDPDVFSSDFADDYALKQLKHINWQIVNITTPANYIHLMRRHMQLPFRKPLVVMTPKVLLKSPLARSNIADFLPGTEFKRLYPDDGAATKNPTNVQKLLLCSGKVYYELQREREEKKLEEQVAIVRIEQICPFPYDLLKEQLKLYPNAAVTWVQEEPKNAGSWYYVQPRIWNLLRKHMEDERPFGYVGRIAAPSPATGNKKQHMNEQATLLSEALEMETKQ